MTEQDKRTHRPWATLSGVLLMVALIVVATRQADAQTGECATGEGAVVYAGSGTDGDTFAVDLSDGSSQFVASLNAEVGNHMSANSDATGGVAGAQLYFDWDDGGSSREHGRYEPPAGFGSGAGDGNTAGSLFMDMSNIYFGGAPGHGYMDIEGAGATVRNRFIISAPEAQWFCYYGCNGGAQAPNNATEEFFLIKLDETGEVLSDGTTIPTLGTTVFDLNYRNASGFPSLGDDLSGLGDILVVDDDTDSDPRTLFLYGSTTGSAYGVGSVDGFWRFELFADTDTDTYTLSNFVVINSSPAASGNQLAADGNNNVFWAPGDDSTEIQQVDASTGTGTPLWSGVTGAGITDLTSAANCGTQLDFGDAPASYEATGSGDSPAGHTVTDDLYLGAVAPDVDINSATLLSVTADRQVDGDDRIGSPYASAIDDEEGIVFPTPPAGAWQDGDQFNVTATTHNDTGMDALVCGWIDFDDDGSFENDADERVCETVADGATSAQLSFTIPADFVSDGGDDATYYSRFRLTTAWSSAGDATPFGRVADGEVEDHPIDLGTLPVSLNAFESSFSGNGLVIKWQTASETNNVGFELWGRSRGRWRVLGEFIASQGMNSALPQTYEETVPGGSEIRALALVDYDTRGRPEGFGPFEPGEDYGQVQPAERIDWEGPRLRRKMRLLARGFVNTAERRIERSAKRRHNSSKRFSRRGTQRSSAFAGFSNRDRWRRLIRQRSERHGRALASEPEPVIVDDGATSGGPEESSDSRDTATVLLHAGALTHVEVTEPGIQRVSYAALKSAGLDLAGVRHDAIAVTWRGEPVARWIGGGDEPFGPGRWIEFIGHPPEGDDALYIDANLYQVAVDPDKVRQAKTASAGRVRNPSESFQASVTVDRPLLHHPQSPTGDPWVERVELVRGQKRVTLDVVLEGPVAPGPASLFVNLGSITDLPDKTGTGGEILPEHNVEVWLKKPGDSGFTQVTTSSVSGQHDWEIVAPLPSGVLEPGTYKMQLRFSTAYRFSLLVVDRYGLRYAASYRGASLDFAPDPAADGYRIAGLSRSSIAAYGEGAGGSLVRLEPVVERVESGYVADLPQVNAARVWVNQAPHEPQVFTTEAPGDLLDEPGDLVVVAESSFIGTPALEDYVQSKAAFNPVVVDIEDIYNAVGYGMAVPSAITDYLKARNARHPFSHVQLVGTDCYDRMNYISDCVSFVPLPTARVGVTVYSPSQNRLVDLDGDGVGDKAVGQFSVRDESELATVVEKGARWRNNVAGLRSALLVAEGSDGKHDFLSQIQRLRDRIDWSGTEVLDMADHDGIGDARRAFMTALAAGQTLTMFSGHSSPSVWGFRSLLTPGTARSLANEGLPTMIVPLACETTYDISPNANTLGHQLMYAGDRGALAISGAVSLSSLRDNERMANYIVDGLKSGVTLGEAVQTGRDALGPGFRMLHDNWVTQGDITATLSR